MCPAYRAKNETAASWAVVIDIGWNGRSRDVVDMENLTRRPTPRFSHEVVRSDWLFRMPSVHLAEAQLDLS